MKKKRNTKSKGKWLALLTLLFLLLCVGGTYYSVKKFYDSINTALTKMNEKPIATVTFKHKTAQRKFEERMIWDRLSQHSPVYNGDTIRIAPESEATIYFEDGNIIELGENTMAQIFYKDGKAQTSIQGGNVVVDSTNATNGAMVSFGDSQLELNAGSSLVGTNFSEDGAKIDVVGGDVVFSGADGIARTLDEGNSIAFDKNNQERSIPMITIINPRPNEKILNFDGRKKSVDFKWNKKNFDENETLVLEISLDKKFNEMLERKELKNITQTKINLQNGNYYWRIYPKKAGMEFSAQSKISVLDIPNLQLITPENNYSYTYKTRQPEVRFLWTQNDWISEFEIEVANNPQMENPVIRQRVTTPSSIISSLGEGVWYWHIVPFYTINNLGWAEPSEVRSFTITKSDTLGNAELIYPEDEDIVNTANNDTLGFSWKKNSEISEYEIVVSTDKDFSENKIKQRLKSNYLAVKPSELGMQIGTWYWYVSQFDSNGDFVNKSKTQKFYTDKIEFEQRIIYPPEDFAISNTDILKLRFAWKTNIKSDTVFQIARDRNFKNLVVNEISNEQSFQGAKLSGGNYYWRIIAPNTEKKYSTKPLELHVVVPLEKPTLVSPKNNSLLSINENSKSIFRWNSVEGADYYLFNFYKTGDSENPIRSQKVTATSYSLALDNIKDDSYDWSVQAATNEKPYAKSRFSEISKSNFRIKQVRKPKMLASATLLGEAVNSKVFGAERIRKSRTIDFEWSPIPDATDYMFTLRDSHGTVLINRSLKETRYRLNDMAELGNGHYTWSIQALENSKDGKPLRRGEISTTAFTIDLPDVDEIIVNDTGILYGI